MGKRKHKRQRGQSALTDKKMILFAAGIFLVSISAHLAGFLTLKGMAENGAPTLWRGILPLLFGVAGIACIGICILRKETLRPLLYLAVLYLGIQLILSLLMGGIAAVLDNAFNLDGETVKNTVDMIIRIVQIPLRAGACLFLMEILIEKPLIVPKLFFKTSAAFAIYTVFQYLAGYVGYSPALTVLRTITAGIAAVMILYYVYAECRKAGE